MDSIFAAFPKILEQFEANPDAREAFVFAAWRRSVGELLNEHTSPAKLAGSRLRVAVANLTWQRHLESMAAQILAKLNGELGRTPVSFIEFFIDEKMANSNRQERGPVTDHDREGRPDIDNQIAQALRQSAEAINDEDLRNAFLQAAASCLERKERMAKIV